MKSATFSTDELPAHLVDRDRFQVFRDLYVQNVGSVDIKDK